MRRRGEERAAAEDPNPRPVVFHVQLREGSQVARAFNLSEPAVRRQFIAPLQAGGVFTYADQEWEAARTKLTILEGPELRGNELMMGQGWANAQRVAGDVTDRIQRGPSRPSARDPAVDRLKERLVGRLAAGPVALGEVVDLAEDLMRSRRVSELVAAAELTAWELLHEGLAALEADRAPVPAEEWQPRLLSPDSWLDRGPEVRLSPMRR